MSLFQTQIERQYIAGITTDLVPIYKKYVDYFGNAAIQANILEVIEEQYQGEFVRALFVDILGYTAQPHPNFNLIREKKNETDAKSADAAISINNQIVAVIELKDHKTQDLKKVEVQAFGYKNNHKNCHYVVTSNFERLRFYIDNAVDFIEFDLFNLSFDEFRRLWLCLSHESIAKNLPQEIKNQSVSSEDVITKKLYKDYSIFKRQLFDSIVTLNPEYEKLLLFKKTQKLLDRFLFLFFAEDKQLLPANSVIATIEKWKKFNADPMNDYQSLYSRFVKYFKLLDVGYKDANTEIYAYNGGLFAPDDVLNQIRLDDVVISENVLKLAVYDYDTDVDVNILGHIFENSLNEIEQVANEITTGEKTTSKRKQDGVFYTPRYITQYIVENTVGRLCEEKKTELGIGENLFEYKRADKKKQALKVFDAYREWLLQITIVDPACGSGAFLNTALDFLIAEHKWIDNQQDKIAGSNDHYSMGLSNIENTILENNLFGVDINEESVEIAKLSLWLRTAKPHRKLSSLNKNIKCGNSLIDDPAVAGDKAFDWYKEFPQVFGREQKRVEVNPLEKTEVPDYLKLIKEKSVEAQLKAEQGIALSKEALEITKQLAEYAEKLDAVSEPKSKYEKKKGGFDVVIGNPPYVNSKEEMFSDKIKLFYNTNYKTSAYQIDLYLLFLEKSISLISKNGVSSLIVPNSWLNNLFLGNVRKFFLTNTFINEIVLMQSNTFVDASVDTLIVSFSKSKENGLTKLSKCNNSQFEIIGYQNQANWLEEKDSLINIHLTTDINRIFKKLIDNSIPLESIADIGRGVGVYHKRVGHTKEFIERDPYQSNKIVDETFIPYLRGRNVQAGYLSWNNDSYISYGKWLAEPREPKFFSGKRVLMRQIPSERLIVTYIDKDFVIDQSVFIARFYDGSKFEPKSVAAILGSKLLSFYFRFYYSEFDDLFPKVKLQHFKSFPISKQIQSSDLSYKEDKILILNKELFEASQKFQRMLQRKFDLEELSGKLQNWYLLSYKEFIAELGKKKVKLTLAQEAEWEEYFIAEQAKVLEIKKQIDETDREIDRMVYALYELTEEEIRIVEGSENRLNKA